MSKVTRVIVLCPNGKRQTVNLSPNSNFLQILEEVCRKQNINPDDFDICHQNKPLDLSLPVRFANLSNNAQLELQPAKTTRKDSLVNVVLQLESGERLMKDFVPSTSVWNVVEQCLINKPNKSNLDDKTEPVCIYMRQKLMGNTMKETTLRDLGLIKGSALIRLMYRNPEDLSDQAHTSTPLTKLPKDSSPIFLSSKLSNNVNEMECEILNDESQINAFEDTEVSAVTSNKSLLKEDSFSAEENHNLNEISVKDEDNFMKDVSQEKEPTISNISSMSIHANEKIDTLSEQKMEIDFTSMVPEPTEEEIGAIHYIGGRHAVLYSLDDITDIKKADLPDDFFELTIEDIRYLMEEFKKTRIELENQPLITKELRNRKILQKLGRFKQTVIRVYFPERLVLQAVFEAQETVRDVCDFIRNYLEDRSLNFYLYTAPPKEKKDPAKTLIESMLIPAAVVYFGCEIQNTSYLLKSLKDKVSDPRAASLAAYESRKQAICEDEAAAIECDEIPLSLAEPEVDYRLPGPSFPQTSGSIRTSEKVPKWLKMSRK